ncbi:MAG: hypothetical protein PHT41_01550 [Candidatus Omnitrophica bacterium]|nr:hypothetical protein [Candidatus Omnitrophota bacterium]
MTEDSFFDRKSYLQAFSKRINDLKDGYRQNIAVIGDELVGKTSIFFKFLNTFQDNRIIIIYLEIRLESLDSFIRRFIGILLYNFLINSNLPLKEDLDFLIKKSEKYIPKTVEKIRFILNGTPRKKTNNSFAELLSLCDLINQETGKSCVVIFDEFLNLESLGFKNLYREWSKLLIMQKNTMYIIISSMKFKTKAILSGNLSLLFGNFEVVTVEPFDIRNSERYLESKLCSIGLIPGLRDFIVHFTGGYPFYLQVLTEALLKSNQNQLSEIIENLLFDNSGVLNQKFSNYIKRFLDSSHCKEYLSILYLISSGRNKIKDIAHILGKQKKELCQRINHLLELDTITRSGDFLRINDRVFSFWLKFVYQEKMQSLTFDAKNQKEKFCDMIEDKIQEFILSSQKPLTERMHELLRLFEDEMVQIETKKIRLNHFREIKPLEFRNISLKDGLIGRSNDSLWIIAIKREMLTEEDITVFSKECKKYRHKLQRKIIITLEDIDMNTRLRALEEKIWTWDINNLNLILDLYSKPRVIV